MDILLDTNALIWYLSANPRIDNETIEIIESSKSTTYYSSINIVEISIKVSMGKLKIKSSYLNLLSKSFFKELTLTAKHANRLTKLPYHHKDPFDRLLIAQAKVEQLMIITSDRIFKSYKIPVLEL